MGCDINETLKHSPLRPRGSSHQAWNPSSYLTCNFPICFLFLFFFFFLPYLSLTFQNRPALVLGRMSYSRQLHLVFSLLCLFCAIVFLRSCNIVDCVTVDLVIILAYVLYFVFSVLAKILSVVKITSFVSNGTLSIYSAQLKPLARCKWFMYMLRLST